MYYLDEKFNEVIQHLPECRRKVGVWVILFSLSVRLCQTDIICCRSFYIIYPLNVAFCPSFANLYSQALNHHKPTAAFMLLQISWMIRKASHRRQTRSPQCVLIIQPEQTSFSTTDISCPCCSKSKPAALALWTEQYKRIWISVISVPPQITCNNHSFTKLNMHCAV